MKKIGVFLYSLNSKGKHHHHYVEFMKLVDVARFLITYKPPRGYELVKVEIEEAEQMEMELFERVRERDIQKAKEELKDDWL